MKNGRHSYIALFWILPVLLTLASVSGHCQIKLVPRELKKLSVEELMDVEVTLVSRAPEKLTEAASAIQVITGEDIRRSGATNIPDALRLVTNLQVAQLNSSSWIISARGFNTVFANKLLVMIDGRTVYTPLFGGVIWEQQNVLLEDIDRIEVVSGPGATLWGANAVNGVINIITKNTKDTPGGYASLSVGNFVKDIASFRYGGKLGAGLTYKIYGQHFDRGQTTNSDGTKNADDWAVTLGGFRLDYNNGSKDLLSFEGEYYGGKRSTLPGKSPMNGQHLSGNWTHKISEESNYILQVYYDRYYREDNPASSSDKLNTLDVDFQYAFAIRDYQRIVVGTGYRVVKDDAFYSNVAGGGIVPRYKSLDLFNAFVQDEIKLARHLHLMLGTKLLHNVYTGLEWQPSVRLSLTGKNGTLWSAVSRAVRTPSRLDVDYFLPMTPRPPTEISVAGGPEFVSEKLVAYELGYRFQPNKVSTVSVAAFYNVYNDLYSVELLPNTLTYQIQNGSKGTAWGAEFSGSYQVNKIWRLRAGYTFFNKDLRGKPGHVFDPDYLGNDVRNQVMAQSILDLPWHLQFDAVGRYLDALAQTAATAHVPSYFTADIRLAYVIKGLEIAVAGQNLTRKNHTEYHLAYIPRRFNATISTRF